MALIEHVALFADDLPKLRDFYVDVMGMSILLDNSAAPTPGYFLGDDRGTSLEIILRPPGAPRAGQRYVCHVAFTVPDVRAFRTKLEAMGLVFETEIDIDTEEFSTCFFADPEGNRIQLVRRSKPLGS
ncbi:MAG: VOC family protein [Isosphaeraceae bacterium]|nr:VOC family protein [Isosphaeraceae bacterium]